MKNTLLRPAPRVLRPAHAVVALTLAAWFPHAVARDAGITPGGVAYVSGGSGLDEREEMRALLTEHNFWLMTAAAGSGHYLADVEVRVVPVGTDTPVLEHRMDGPWLFARLPPGRYEVQAAWDAGGTQGMQVRRSTVSVVAGQPRQMVMYFRAPEEAKPAR